jgi:SRSO17 transposase
LFLADYQEVFRLRTHNLLPKAVHYLQGLFQSERNKRNIERMVEQTDSNYQGQQQFISDSPWSSAALMDKVGVDTNNVLGDKANQALSIDESSNGKAGKHSVGVSHQYNGNKGKLDNCQTGVYASLSRGNKVGIINAKLFLPDEWINDVERCAKAGIPKNAIVKKTKIQLGIELIAEAKKSGIGFGWVNADGLYGNSYAFGKAIEEMGENFVVDVHKDQMVYLTEPKIYIPAEEKKRGRKPIRPVTDTAPVKAQDYIKTLRNTDFKEVNIRKGTKGWLKANVHTLQVWVWDHEEMQARERTLVIRKSMGGKDETKYSLSSFSVKSKTVQQFAYMQAQRFWIERAFEDQKGELGMSDYQVRKYMAWCHHQALVMLALLFVNKQKTIHQENIPLLSVRDVRLQLIASLKEGGAHIEKEIDQMLVRHHHRVNDILRHYPDNDYF